eukprot:1169243-Rhodomonas_salina.3
MHAEGDMIHGCDADTTGAALQRQFLSATTTDPADDTTKPLPKVLDCGPLSNDCNTNQGGEFYAKHKHAAPAKKAPPTAGTQSAIGLRAVRYRPTRCTISAYALLGHARGTDIVYAPTAAATPASKKVSLHLWCLCSMSGVLAAFLEAMLPSRRTLLLFLLTLLLLFIVTTPHLILTMLPKYTAIMLVHHGSEAAINGARAAVYGGGSATESGGGAGADREAGAAEARERGARAAGGQGRISAKLLPRDLR